MQRYIRVANCHDTEMIAELFTQSVHQIASNSYSPQQLAAWAPTRPNILAWKQRLEGITTLLAEVNGQPAGFISYASNGYIAFLYSSPQFNRQGVASELFDHAKSNLAALQVTTLFTDASLEAKSFFETKGLMVLEAQQVERDGENFKRFVMITASAYCPLEHHIAAH